MATAEYRWVLKVDWLELGCITSLFDFAHLKPPCARCTLLRMRPWAKRTQGLGYCDAHETQSHEPRKRWEEKGGGWISWRGRAGTGGADRCPGHPRPAGWR